MHRYLFPLLLSVLLIVPATTALADMPIMAEVPQAPATPAYLYGNDLSSAAVAYLSHSGLLDHLGGFAVTADRIAEGPEATLVVFGLTIDGIRVVEHSTAIVIDPKSWQVLATSSRAKKLPQLRKQGRLSPERALGTLDGPAELVYFTDGEGVLHLSWMGTVQRADERRIVVADATSGLSLYDALVDTGVTNQSSPLTKSNVPGKPTLAAPEQTGGNDFMLRWTGSGSVQEWKIYSFVGNLPSFSQSNLFDVIENTFNLNAYTVWVNQKTWWWVQGCNFFGCGPVSNARATTPMNQPF